MLHEHRHEARFSPDLIDDALEHPPEDAAPAPAAPRPARRHPQGYDRLRATLANGAALLVALLLWWIGAQFTLAFAHELGVPLARLDGAKWLIPLAITAIEVGFWPRRGQQRNLTWLWLIVAGLDLLTSVVGGVHWLAGRNLAGIALPETHALLWLIAGGTAGLCAFWPERLGRTAIHDLRTCWRI